MAYHIDGEKVRLLREARGWSQEDLARRADGIDRSTISRIESGDRQDVSISVATRIARALGVLVDQIVKGSLARSDPGLLVMLSQIEDMTPEERRSVEEFVQFVLSRRRDSGRPG